MISVAHLFEDDKENVPEEKLIKSNNRKKLLIAGLLGVPVGMSISQIVNQITDKK